MRKMRREALRKYTAECLKSSEEEMDRHKDAKWLKGKSAHL
jgi:hypothetical protein